MLINALCDYYNLLQKSGSVLPKGYSHVNIHYLISLTKDGIIDSIIDYQTDQIDQKQKIKKVPQSKIFPKRSEKTAIIANVIDHRPLYIFGLNLIKDTLTAEDTTNKARDSHQAFVEKQLDFINGLDTPLVNAFRLFLTNWNPENETDNIWLKNLKKAYPTSGYAFCLNTDSSHLLQDEDVIRQRWEKYRQEQLSNAPVYAQCAITGMNSPQARLHNKIKGVPGGQSTGTSLVSFNEDSGKSYGNDQSFNSNISTDVMEKYTESLNFLLAEKDSFGKKKHTRLFGETTVVYWAQSEKDEYIDLFSAALFGTQDDRSGELLENLFNNLKTGMLTTSQVLQTEELISDTDFYILGLKPASARLTVKFFYQKKFGDIIQSAVQHQKDLQIVSDRLNTRGSIAFWEIICELTSPQSTSEKVSPFLLSQLFKSILFGTNYPIALLETVVRRCKTDVNYFSQTNTPYAFLNRTRASVIKAYLNRSNRKNNRKEEINMALDTQNKDAAYLCGRLFAVLEKVQQEASNNTLNRTIKDSYFSSAASTPAVIFPRLLSLCEYHLRNLKYEVKYRKLIQDIMSNISTEFPNHLTLPEQGKFMLGYYQQYQNFFEKKSEENASDETI